MIEGSSISRGLTMRNAMESCTETWIFEIQQQRVNKDSNCDSSRGINVNAMYCMDLQEGDALKLIVSFQLSRASLEGRE